MTDALQAGHAAREVLEAREELRTVLIFAHECAPYNRPESTIGAQRPAQFAKYLPEFGWRAIVLCCDNAKRGRGWSDEDASAVREAIERSDPNSSVVIATPSLPWDGMLDRAWQRAMRANGAPLSAIVRKPLTFAKFFTGDYSQAWQPCARAAARIIARNTRMDACIGEHSPDAGIFLARWFSRRYGVPWVADFRDPMLFGFPPRVRPLLEPFARRMLRQVSHVVNVTPRCVELDEELFGKPATLITNGFDPDWYGAPEPARSRESLRIVYTGNVWLPKSLSVFMDGLAELRRRIGDERFARVRFVYRGGSASLVANAAKSAGVADALDCAARVPHTEALSLLRAAHLLLVFSTSAVEHRDPYWAHGVYPGKTFEYLGARRPIICVPGDGASLDALLRDARAGTSVGDPGLVAGCLENALSEFERTGDLPSLDNASFIARFSRQVGAQQMAHVLDGVTMSPDADEARRTAFSVSQVAQA